MTEERKKLSESPEWVAITAYAEAMERIAELESGIREHKEACKGCTGEAYDAKLWNLLPD